MVKFSRSEINKAIDILHGELIRKDVSQKVYLILIGAASLIVQYRLRRATSDVDILDSGIPRKIGGLGALLSRLGYHVVSDTIVNLHPDYIERLDPITQKGNIHVLCLGPYDLAISKISRGLARDIDDILSSDLINAIEISRLERYYFEAVSYWIGNPEVFNSNWDLFIREYEQVKNRISK